MFILITLHLVREIKPICNTFTVRKTDIDPGFFFRMNPKPKITFLKINKILFCRRFKSSQNSYFDPGVPKLGKYEIGTKSQDLKEFLIPRTRIPGPEKIHRIRNKNSSFDHFSSSLSYLLRRKWGILCIFCCGRCVGVSGG